ncbi:MAG: leucine-rich repeat domain-containing protein [Clostridiales bacterium]|jgi:Leucine-rich repeat (LRR) protein|nr:leucine-rich repeat domain-containing protein [Clostridiales bacterium]
MRIHETFAFWKNQTHSRKVPFIIAGAAVLITIGAITSLMGRNALVESAGAGELEASEPSPSVWETPAPQQKTLVVADKNLEAALRRMLNQPLGALYEEDLSALTRQINLSSSQIHDIAPLTALTQTNELFLAGNQIQDIAPLASLLNIQKLYLFDNQIQDITPLGELVNTTALNLDRNEITNVSALASLTQLIHLNLTGNQITNVAPLASLTNLKLLSLSDNYITDAAPLSALTELRQLYLSNNRIRDIEPLKSLTNLISLTLDGNHLTQDQIDELGEALPVCDILWVSPVTEAP